MAYWRRCGGPGEKMWRPRGEEVAALRRRCGGPGEKMWRPRGEEVVAHVVARQLS